MSKKDKRGESELHDAHVKAWQRSKKDRYTAKYSTVRRLKPYEEKDND